MEIPLVLLTLALMTPVINGASFGSLNSAKTGIEIFNTMMAEIKTNVETYVQDIPNTEAYKMYRETFVNILKKFNDEILCSGRLVIIYKKLNDVLDQLNSDTSEEAKKIQEIVVAHRNENFATKYKYGLIFLEYPDIHRQCEEINDTMRLQIQERSKFIKAARENVKDLIASIKSQMEFVSKAMSETDPKNKYKLEIENLLKEFNEKSPDDLCDRKLVRIYGKYNELYEKMNSDWSDEAQTAIAIHEEYSVQENKNQLHHFINAIPDAENYGKYKKELESISMKFDGKTKDTIEEVLYKFEKSEEVKKILEIAEECLFKNNFNRYRDGIYYMEDPELWELKFC